MSFRVNATHPLLKPVGPPPDPVNNAFTSRDEEKVGDISSSSFMTDSFMNNTQSQVENRPKSSNQKGMAIRTVPSAQPDYM